MMDMPRAPLLLGLAGLIPFVWSALTILFPELGMWTAHNIGPRFAGPYVGIFYGPIILAFMSGVLWGFTTKLEGGQATSGYVMSVIPALWAFIMTGTNPTSSGIYLIVGFIGILGLDWLFWQYNVAPEWWMRLRFLLTAIVVTCLSIGVFL